MGREIRRVPPNWKHPTRQVPDHRSGRMREDFQPMRDSDYDAAMKDWLDELQAWLNGGMAACIAEHPDQKYDAAAPYSAFADWHGEPPDRDYYRPRWTEEPTWYQVYETVSEGTPVTPPFATKEELIDYLCANGDFWDQRQRRDGVGGMNCQPWSREVATNFVNAGWAPSFAVSNAGLMSGVEAMTKLKPKE